MSTYLRELEHARRDAIELHILLFDLASANGPELPWLQLMTAIGLASTAHDALLRAAKAHHTKGPKA